MLGQDCHTLLFPTSNAIQRFQPAQVSQTSSKSLFQLPTDGLDPVQLHLQCLFMLRAGKAMQKGKQIRSSLGVVLPRSTTLSLLTTYSHSFKSTNHLTPCSCLSATLSPTERKQGKAVGAARWVLPSDKLGIQTVLPNNTLRVYDLLN